MFSSTSLIQLSKMKVDITKYHDDLLNSFGMKISYFDQLISEFSSATLNDKSKFLEFCIKYQIREEECSELYNGLYEMFTNLCLYNEYGLFDLFKGKQAEWGTLKVLLSQEDFPDFDKNLLDDEIIIYRGMSLREYEIKDFTQHWTTDINIARKFAFHTYSDMPRGIVVQAEINKDHVVYYENISSEKELIPIVDRIKNPIIIER